MRRRGCLLIGLGLVLAVVTGALVFRVLQQADPATAANMVAPLPTPTSVPTVSIPVAAHELSAGTTITTTDIAVRQYPVDLVPVGIMTDTGDLEGQALIEGLQEGEFFQATQLRGGEDRPISESIEPEKVAMAFSREDLLNKSDVIQEGDRVDLMLTIEIEEETATETRKGKSTNYTLQNIKVLRIVRDKPTENNPNPEVKTILFEMTPQDAVIAKFVKDAGGTLDFTLRSPADDKPFITEMINQDFMFDNYGFKAPVSSTKPKSE